MSTLPPKDDPERSEREHEAIKARDKVTQATEALKEGKLPSTGQVTGAIEAIQRSDTLHDTAHGLSPLGQQVLADVEKLLDTTKKIFEEKNIGNELQNAIYYSGKATKDVGGDAKIPESLKNKATSGATTTQSLVQDALKKTLLLPQLLMSSSEFRKLINDIHSIIQDALLRAIPEREPADENEEQQVYEPGMGTDQEKTDQEKTEQEKTFQQAAEETKQQARKGTYPIAKEAATITGGHVKEFSEGKKGFKETATGGAKQLATHFKGKVSGYQITEEQRDCLVNRFKNVMIEAQAKPEYQAVLENLLDIISRIYEHSKGISGEAVNTAKRQTGESVDQTDLQKAQENAKRLIENFANHKSLDPLINALKDLGNNVRRDDELRSYLQELRQFVISSLRDSQFVQETNYVEHGSKLIEKGRYLLLERYSDDTDRVADEASAFNAALQDDELTTQWTRDFESVTRDLFFDERNQPTVKFELIKDFGKILPIIGERFKYLALPRIENSDEEYDYTFDNIVLHLDEVLPKHLRVNFSTDINLGRKEQDILQNTLYIEISNINADARNITFYYNKKKGLINMIDVGMVDFSVPKNGLTIKLKVLLNPPNDSNPAVDLRVLEVDAIIDDLKIRLHDTRHDFLYTLLTPLVEKRLKKQFANMITEKLIKSVDYTRENINKVQSQVRGRVSEMARKRKESKQAHVGEEKKQKHAWETPTPQYNTGTQVREE